MRRIGVECVLFTTQLAAPTSVRSVLELPVIV